MSPPVDENDVPLLIIPRYETVFFLGLRIIKKCIIATYRNISRTAFVLLEGRNTLHLEAMVMSGLELENRF